MRKGRAVRENDWTAAEVAYLRKWAGIKSTREMSLDLERGKSAVCQKMKREGITGFKTGRQHGWTKAEFEALRNVKPEESSRAFARRSGKGVNSVRFWAHKMGIRFQSKPGRRPQEVERIRELAKTCTVRQAAERVSITTRGLHKLAQREGFRFLPARIPAAPKQPKQKRVQCIRKKKPERKFSVYVAQIEYCPVCGAPVSNWQGHYERMGHQRRTA